MDDATGMIAGAQPADAAPDEPAAATAETDRPETSADGARAATPAPVSAGGQAGGGEQPPAADQPAGTDPAKETGGSEPGAPEPPQTSWPASPGFRERGRMRRRLAFLRRARELAYRDLGGLVFNLHRFGQRHDELVLAKLSVLERLDTELRSLEGALRERRAVTVLRVAGITACPRCAAIHASEDRFCPNCGLALGRHPDLPIAGPTEAAAPAPSGVDPPAGDQQSPAAQPAAPPHAVDTDATASHSTVAAAGAGEGEPTEILRPPYA